MSRPIYSMAFTPDRKIIIINFTEPQYGASGVIMQATGGCCSESWFEHFDLETATNTSGDFVEIKFYDDPVKEENIEDELAKTKYYKVSLVTTKESYDFELRNDSNGYYGGFVAVSFFGKALDDK